MCRKSYVIKHGPRVGNVLDGWGDGASGGDGHTTVPAEKHSSHKTGVGNLFVGETLSAFVCTVIQRPPPPRARAFKPEVPRWFASQARADVDDLLPRVRALMEHPEPLVSQVSLSDAV